MKAHPIRFSLFLILIIAMGARFFYGQVAQPTLSVYPDSPGYYSLGTTMLTSPSLKTIITPYRTPVYPLFTVGTALLLGKLGTPIGSPSFQSVSNAIFFLQSVIGIFTLLLIYKGLIFLDKNKVRPLLITLFFAIDPMLLSFEHTMLTETLSVFFAVLTTYAMVVLLTKPRIWGFALLFLAGTLGFLTRPAFLTIPLAGVPFLLWYFFKKKNRTAVGLTILTLLLYLSVPLSYIRMNEIQWGYRGIQYVSDINILGRILEFGISPEAGKDVAFLYTEVQKQQELAGPTSPYRFFDTFDPSIYSDTGDTKKLEQLHIFVTRITKANVLSYTLYALTYIPAVFFNVSPITVVPVQPESLITILLILLWNVYHLLQYATILVLPAGLCVLFLFFKHPKVQSAAAAICFSIIFFQVLSLVLLAYDEDYGRLAMIFRPHMYIFFSYGAVRWKAFLFSKTIL